MNVAAPQSPALRWTYNLYLIAFYQEKPLRLEEKQFRKFKTIMIIR